MTKEEAFNIGLPKWPQCIITGEKITKEQALEIIRRTDCFFQGHYGNDKIFRKHADSIIKRPIYEYDSNNNYNMYCKNLKIWESKWQLINTHYLTNDWIDSCFIFGPHGWCHPDGTIEYHYNVGKWPDVEEIYNELKILASEFPFLNMSVTLMSDECVNNGKPLVSMKVSNGMVEFIDTLDINQLSIPKDKPDQFYISKIMSNNYDWTHSFSLTQIQQWANQIFKNK